MDAFTRSFGLDPKSKDFSNLQGNIVSVLQAGCFFGALASFYISDTFGRKMGLIIADIIFIIGSLVQTLIFNGSLTQLYIGRVIGGFGVGLISAIVRLILCIVCIAIDVEIGPNIRWRKCPKGNSRPLYRLYAAFQRHRNLFGLLRKLGMAPKAYGRRYLWLMFSSEPHVLLTARPLC